MSGSCLWVASSLPIPILLKNSITTSRSAKVVFRNHFASVTGRNFLQSRNKHNGSSVPTASQQGLYSPEDIQRRVEELKRELRKYYLGSYQYRQIQTKIRNLSEELNMETKTKRKKLEGNTISVIPHVVTVEVLSNGTTHMCPSMILRTPFRCYMFNCPELSSRMCPSLRIRPNQLEDIFITRLTWNNIGGISGLLLSKNMVDSVESLNNILPPVRLHGPKRLKNHLERQRPFMDVDFGVHKNCSSYPCEIEEYTYTNERHEDEALRIDYIPLFDALSSQLNKAGQTVDVAYLVELKPTQPHIDPLKLMQLKVPNGPLIGELKAGRTVTLPDGRVINPEDVTNRSKHPREFPHLLVVDIESATKLDAIRGNSLLTVFVDKATKQLNYIVHFTDASVMQLPAYQEWMGSFGPECRHLVLNGTGQVMPQSEGIYKAQRMLADVFGEAFPELYPSSETYEGKIITQDEEVSELETKANKTDKMGPVHSPSHMQRFPMRGSSIVSYERIMDKVRLDFESGEIDQRLEKFPEEIPGKVETFKKVLKEALETRLRKGGPDIYPQITFLGTSSATPSKYRNVSGHLLQLNSHTNVLIDCGEGTFGQLRVLFGPEKCAQLLTQMNAVFITHSHQDHVNGLFTIVMERIRAFEQLGVAYRPLILVCNRNVRQFIGNYATAFGDIERHMMYVDVTIFYRPDSPTKKGDPRTNYNRVMVDVEEHFAKELYSPRDWNLRSVRAVQVIHTRQANGFIFECEKDGRRIVFSGDTKPCELLEQYGRDADVLVHECTFEDGMERDAEFKRHSTMQQAFDSAHRMRAKNTIFTHFSSRYSRVPPLPDYLIQAGNFSVAMDNMVVPFDMLPVFPHLLPLYHSLFKEELFELEVKHISRTLRSKEGKGSTINEPIKRQKHMGAIIRRND